MNVIQLCGGLGNQLFQYAFGRVQMSNGIDVRYDDTWYEKYGGDRPYRLDKFDINIRTDPFVRQKTVNENSKHHIGDKGFSPQLMKMDNCNFSGYWQYLAYYVDILPVLKKELCIRKELFTEDYLNLRRQITENPSTSIHVRRGDYIGLNPKYFQIMPLSYYFKALEHTKGDLFVFSDDLEWCKENFRQDYFSRQITFVALEDYLDFELMKLCAHNIICSSSFSWWAAILNSNSKKVVVAPKRWILNRVNQRRYNNKIHYPKDWIKL